MTLTPSRAILIGLDGANYEAMKPLLERNLLPNLGRLLEEGTRCENAYPPYPTLTGSNWATIATGAWPGTHGVTDMSYHVTGEPAHYWHSGFTSDAVEAETLWEAAARAGKRAITLKYTGSWPPRRPDLTMVDGGGGRPFWGGSFLELSHSQLYSTEAIPNAHLVQTDLAKGWRALPASGRPPLEARIDYRPETGNIPEFLQFQGEVVRRGGVSTWWILAFAAGDAGYDRLALCRERDFATAFAVMREGELSDSFCENLEIDGRRQRGCIKVAPAHLDAQNGGFDLFFSQVYPTDGFTQPATLGAELVSRFGAYFDLPPYSEEAMGWFRHGPELFLRFMEYQNAWLGGAGRYSMQSRPWELFALQCHCIDYANHNFVAHHDWSAERRAAGRRHLERCYQSVDRMVGDLLEGAGPDALVCVVSDHGAAESDRPEVSVNEVLAQAGLLVYQESDRGSVSPRIDRTRTLAEHQRNGYVYISLQGRDPGGVVPAEQYEAVRDRVVDALTAYREPTSGRNPFSLILRKEDARILGLYDHLGRDIGDVVYAVLPGFEREHGRLLPGVTLGGQTLKSLLVWRGPGIKRGVVVDRTTWLVDVAPTIAHVMGWPMPSEAEGGVVYQALAGHTSDFPRPESLRRQAAWVEQFKEQVASPQAPAARVEPATESAPAAEAAMPETVQELQAALREARAEAGKWRNAFEQRKSILHDNQ